MAVPFLFLTQAENLNMEDVTGGSDALSATMSGGSDFNDGITVAGSFHYECHDETGKTLWTDESHNLFTTLGKNALLDNTYAAPASLVGPFIGLISGVGFTAISAADTMASHAGWNEAQGATNLPDYTGNRQTAVYSAASGGIKPMSAGLSFVFTSAGTNTVVGAFVVAGSGAVNTKASTLGSLMNVGTLSTAQPVISGNTLVVTHSGTIT